MAKLKAASLGNWSKNASKSIVFSSINVLKKIMPNTTETVVSVADTTRDLRSFAIGSKTSIDRQNNILQSNRLGRSAKKIFDTAIDDIKSGNFSLDKAGNDLYDSFDDFGFDTNSGSSEDLNIDSLEASSSSSNNEAALGKAIIASSAAQIDGIREMSTMLAKTQLKSAAMMSEKSANIALFGINKINAGLMGIQGRLDVINQNLVSMIQFQNENVSVTNQAMLQYFDRSLDILNKIDKSLNFDKSSSRNDEINPLLGGGFNLSEYKKMIKKNFDNTMFGTLFSMAKMGLDMSGGSGGIRLPKMLLENLLIPALIPNNIKRSMGKFDKNLTSYLQSALYRIGDLSDNHKNPLLQFIGDLFGMKRPSIKGIGMGNFQKDAMAWNGVAQKTLVEVIPSYLANIESALTRQEQRYYDMETGQFKSRSRLRKEYEENETFYVQNAMKDSMDRLESILKEKNYSDLLDDAQFQKKLDALINGRISGKTSYSSYKDEIKETFQPYLNKQEFMQIINSMEKGFEDAIKAIKNQQESVEKDNISSSAYRHLFNTYGDNTNYSGNIKFAGSAANYFSKTTERQIQEIASMYLAEGKTFKPSNDFIKRFYKASMSGASTEELQNMVGKEIKGSNRKSFGNKLKSRFSSNRNSKFADRVEHGFDRADEILFKYGMGIDYDDISGDNRASSRADNREGTNRVKAPNKRNRDLERQEENLSKMNFRNVTERRTLKDVERNIKDNQKIMKNEDASTAVSNVGRNKSTALVLSNKQLPAKIGASSRFSGAEIQSGEISGIDKSTTNTLKGTVMNLYGAFSDTVTGLFGKEGFFKKIISKDFWKEKFDELKVKLFDEKDGIFKGVTQRFHDAADAIKYVFTGKGYTNSQGKSFPDDDNNVLAHLKNGYNFIYSNTMKYLFGDDYENNETFKKYFKWLAFDKKKKIEEDEKIQKSEASKNSDTKLLTDKSSERKLLTNKNSDIKLLTDKSSTSSNTSTSTALIPIKDIDGKTHNEEIDIDDTEEIQGALQHNLVVSSHIASNEIEKSANKLSTTLFGDPNQDEKKRQESFLGKFRKNLPKMLAAGIVGAGATLLTGGSLGIIGSLFLPSNPLGGAIVGMGVQLLSQNEKFKKFLFGEIGEDGKRAGGLISSKMQASFKKALPLIIGGGVLGGLKHIFVGGLTSNPFTAPLGVMMSTLLPGGVIGGALFGMGTSLIMHNEKFRKILFGEKDDDGNRAGGIFSKGMNVFSKAVSGVAKMGKGGLKGLGIGAISGLVLSKMGILGAAVSLGGPVGMGLAGLGIGIASQTSRFQQFLFGTEEIGPDGKPTGKRLKNGLLHQVRNLLVVNIFDPVKQTIHDEMVNFAYWAKDKIMFPFEKAFGPIQDALFGLKESITDYVKDKFDMLTDGIANIFKATMKKVFSPFTMILGKIGQLAVKGVGLSARMAGSLVAAPINVLSMIMAPRRAKEYANFYKGYVGNLWNQTDENGNKRGILGRIGNVIGGFTNEERLDAARLGYEDAMEAQGKNHSLWMSANRRQKQNKKEWRQAKKEASQWKKIDKFRRDIVNEEKHENVFWTEKRRKEISAKFKKYGLTTGVDTESDLKKLIFHKDDWVDQFVNKKVGLGNGFAETPEMAKAREKTSAYQDLVDERLKDIYDLMKIFANETLKKRGEKLREKDFAKKYGRTKARTKNMGINIDDFNVKDNPEILDMPLYEFDNYKASEEFQNNDFAGWYQKNKSRWTGNTYEYEREEAKKKEEERKAAKEAFLNKKFTELGFTHIQTKGGEWLTPKLLEEAYKKRSKKGTVNSREEFLKLYFGEDYLEKLGMEDLVESNSSSDSSEDEKKKTSPITQETGEKIVNRLDAQNQAIYGGAYDKNEVDKDMKTGEGMSEAAIDRAHTSPEEIASSTTKSFDGLFSKILGFKKKSEAKKAREEREAAETEAAQALGDKKPGTALALFNGEEQEEVETETKEKKKGLFSTLLEKATGTVGGILGSIGSFFANTNNWGKLGIAAGLAYLFRDHLESIFGTVTNFISEKVVPTLNEKIVPFITETVIPGISNFLVTYGPQLIQGATGIITTLMPSLIDGFIQIAGSAAKSTINIVKSALFGGGVKEGVEKGSQEYQYALATGQNMIENEDGTFDIGGSRDYIDEDGEWKSQRANVLSADRLAVYTHGFLNTAKRGSKFARNMTSKLLRFTSTGVGTVLGGLAGTQVLPGIGTIAGAMAGTRIGKGVSNTLDKFLLGTASTAAKNTAELAAKNAAEETTQATLESAAKKSTKTLFLNSSGTETKLITMNTAELAAKNADLGVEKAAEMVAKNSDSTIKKFFKSAISALEKLENNETLKKVLKPFTAINKAVDKTIGKLVTLIKGWITKAATKITDKIAPKLSAKISEKVAKNTAQDAAAAASGGVIAGLFTAYDFISGAFEANKLFGVDSDAVDWKMRAISSLFKGILGLPIVWVVDLIFEIITILLDVDIKRELATDLYKMVSELVDGGESYEKLAKEQAALEIAADNYNAIHGTNLSAIAYKEMTQKGVLFRAGTAIANFVTGKKSEDYSKYEATDAQIQAYINGTYEKPSYNSSEDSVGYGDGKVRSKRYSVGQTMSQADPRWANYPLGKMPNGQTSTMATGGCGPTALSMVASSSVGRGGTDPLSIAKFAKAKGYIVEGGSSSKLFTEGAKELGLKPSTVGKNSLDQSLQHGNPIILSGKGSSSDTPFTKVGHIVTATGIDGRGNVIINDPQTGRVAPYKIDKIKRNMTNAWEYGSRSNYNKKKNRLEGYGLMDEVGENPISMQTDAKTGNIVVTRIIGGPDKGFFAQAKMKARATFTPTVSVKNLEMDATYAYNISQRKTDSFKWNDSFSWMTDKQIVDLYEISKAYNWTWANPSNFRILESLYKEIKEYGGRKGTIINGELVNATLPEEENPLAQQLNDTTDEIPEAGVDTPLNYDEVYKYQAGAFYSPDDDRWKDMKYKTGTIETRGDDLISLAMLLSTVTKKGITPAYLLKHLIPKINSIAYDPTNGINWNHIFDSDGGIQSLEEAYGQDGKPIQIMRETSNTGILNKLISRYPGILSGYKFAGSMFGDGTGDLKEKIKITPDNIGTVMATYSDLDSIAISNPYISKSGGAPIDNIVKAALLNEMVGADGKTSVITGNAYHAALSDGTAPITEEELEETQALNSMVERTKKEEKSDGALSSFTRLLKYFTAIAGQFITSKIEGKEYERMFNPDGSINPKYADILEGNTSVAYDTSNVNYADSVSFTGDKKAFIDIMLPGAINGYDNHNILPSLTLSQGALESGWGKSAIGHNIFGVKAGDSWDGPVQVVNTTEYINGVPTTVQAVFRDYASYEDSVADHSQILLLPRYDKVREAKNYKEATYEVWRAGYATDPNYPAKLNNIIEQNNMSYYDLPENHYSALASIPGTAEYYEKMANVVGPKQWNPNMLPEIFAFTSKNVEEQLSTGYGRAIGYGPDNTASTPYNENLSKINKLSNDFSLIGNAVALSKIRGISYEEAKQELQNNGSINDQNYSSNSTVFGSYVHGTANEQQKALVNKMKSIKGKIEYSLGPVQDPDKGVASCASTVGWAYRKVLNLVNPIMSAGTAAQMQDNRFTTIFQSSIDQNANGKGYVDESRLELGDLIYYRDKNRSATAGRPYRVGHVEMYAGDGKVIGHGGGMGPKEKKLSWNSENIIMARRFNDFAALGYGSDSNNSNAFTNFNFEDEYNKEVSRNLNINNNSKSSQNRYDDINDSIGMGPDSTTRKNQITQKLNVAVNTTGVENKLDVLIDVVKEWWNLDKDRQPIQTNSTNVIGYGNTGSNRPIIINKNNSYAEPDYSNNRLRSIHEKIAGGRR